MSLESKQRLKIAFFIFEAALIGALIFLWFRNGDYQTNPSLWILFLYCFPSEFLIAVVPHEPLLLYFGKFTPALTVALVSALGTLLTEALNFSMFKFISDLKSFSRIHRSRWVKRLIDLFNRAPFFALLVAGFTPVPFYPFRFLVVMARYPLWKYLSAVLISRTPRFFLIAKAGQLIGIPDVWLALLFLALLVVIYIPLIGKFRRLRRKQDGV
jgi:membrane protein YqaA with SNARE-associated domain